MLSKDFTFHEAMKDSPNFRYELNQNERYFDRLHKRMEEMVHSIDNAIDEGQNFMASLYNLTVSLNRLWQDMQIDEAKDKVVAETFKGISEALSQIVYLNKSLVEHAYPSLKTGFESFIKRELGKLIEVKSQFNTLSSSLSDALSKKAAINKNKIQELHDAENSLTAIGTCFSHTGLDYVAQINIAHALKCPAILEALWVFVKEHGNFFKRGAHFFDDQQEFMIGDAIASMRTSYKQIERQMQNRHTIVPKLYSHKSNDSEPEVPTVMEENLKLCLVRPAQTAVERACCFELVTPTKSHLLQADSESLCNAWIRALQRTIQHLHEDDHGTYAQSRISFIENIETHKLDTASTSSAKSKNSENNFKNESPESAPSSSKPNLPSKNDQEKRNMQEFLKQLLSKPGNSKCADCGCEDAKWTSLNLGIIICIECSGVHRSLGVHFSKVRSLTMDTLEPKQRNILLQLGNDLVNSIFLKNLPKLKEGQSIGINKHSDREKREMWITDKYVQKRFARTLPLLAHSRSHSSLNAIANGASSSSIDAVRLRPNTIAMNELSLEQQQQEQSKIDFLENEERISQSSFGSDSNLMQSAKAVIACRESLISVKECNLSEAIRKGDLENVFKWIVQKDFDVNETFVVNGTSTTILHLATEYNQTTMMEFLFLNGAKVNSIDSRLNTALHVAADLGHTIIVYHLLKRNAEKALKNNDGKTPLDLAIEKGHADIVTLLRLHDMKDEFNDDQNSTMDETVESFIGDLAAKQQGNISRKCSNNKGH